MFFFTILLLIDDLVSYIGTTDAFRKLPVVYARFIANYTVGAPLYTVQDLEWRRVRRRFR